MIYFLVAVTTIGAGYAALILLLDSLVGRWNLVIAPGVFLALFISAVVYFEPSKVRSAEWITLTICSLVWSLLPPIAIYRTSRRVPRPSRLLQLGYGMGAFYIATAILFSVFARTQSMI